MKTFISTAIFLGLAAPAFAEGDQLSKRIGEIGIRPAIAELEAAGDLGPDERFALGGLHFLGGVERALQLRYAYGISQSMMMAGDFPFLRLPIPENPSPQPFEPQVIEQLFVSVSADMGKAIDVLDTIGDADDFGTKIDIGDLWFDINMNETRDPGEEMAGVLTAIQRFPDGEVPNVTVRFDTADAKWLSAYAHLLSGISDAVVALHPSERVAEVLADVQKLDAFGRMPEDYYGFIDITDYVTAFIAGMETQPDVALSRSAHAHFLAMIQDNRVFWSRVAAETDDTAEWIPNAQQTSALPLPFPPETAEVWGEVLTEAEEVLEGKRLIAHWRFDGQAGVNLAKFMQDPPELDLIGMIQGRTFLPYLERGPVMDGASLNRFERMLQGDAGLYMVILN